MSNDFAGQSPAIKLSTGASGFAGQSPAIKLSAGTSGFAGSAPAIRFFAGEPMVLTATLRTPVPRLAATLVPSAIATVAVRLPALALAASGTSPAVVTVSVQAPVARLSASLLTGQLVTAALSAPLPLLAATGYSVGTIAFTGAAPALHLDASLVAAVVAAWQTFVLNTRKSILTQYGPEWQFNSYTLFNGKVLACGANGIVVLDTTPNDNGVAIDAKLRTGQESFASSLLKRVPRIYCGVETDGDLIFRTITTEGGTRSYPLNFNGVTGVQQRRIPVGKGPKSRYWQFEVENVNGADFNLDDILVLPQVLRRRVQ